MSFDKFIDPTEVWEERQKAVEQSLKLIAVDELKKLVREHDDEFVDDPWRNEFLQLMADYPHGSFYHAIPQADAEIFYCADKDFGVWVVPGSGSGPLDAKAKRLIKEAINTAGSGKKTGEKK